MVYEDQQVHSNRNPDGLACSAWQSAGPCQGQESQEVHAGAIGSLSGDQRVSPIGLPGYTDAPFGVVRSASCARAEEGAALQHALRRKQYESEGFHCLCRDDLGIRSIIPTTDRGRPRLDGKPRSVRGRYRKLMKQRFPTKTYGQRWQIETVFSMLKRNMGAALRARTYHSQNREIRLRVLTHNLAIL